MNIIEKEKKQEGEVTIWTWFKFFHYGLGIFGILLIFIFGSISGASNILINYYVGIWLEKQQTDERDKLYFNKVRVKYYFTKFKNKLDWAI